MCQAACSSQSLGLSLGLATFYLCWILLCSHFNGIFPYPFLNKLPWPKACPSCRSAIYFPGFYCLAARLVHRPSDPAVVQMCATPHSVQIYKHHRPQRVASRYSVVDRSCVPQGFVLVAFGANVLFYGLFYAGRAIARVLQGNSKDKDE